MYVGVYEREITPPIGCDMPGYYCERLSTGVLDKLFCKAVVISESDENSENAAAVVVVDAVELNREFCCAVAKRASEFSGIPTENISVTATHTHLGVPSGDAVSKRNDEYMALLVKYCADAIYEASENLTDCDVYFGIGKAEGLCFNRDYVLKDGTVCTNPGALKNEIVKSYSGVNDAVPVVSFKDKKGNVIAALIEYACHQDCVGGLEYSGDYSSILSCELKKVYGGDFVSVYLPGAAGDLNNVDYIGNKTPDYVTMGKILAKETERVISKSEKVNAENIKLKSDSVKLKIRRASKEQKEYAEKVLSDPDFKLDKRIMLDKTILWLLLEFEKKAETNPDFEELPVKIIALNDLYIFLLPGELYHQFEDKIRECFKDKKVILAELSNSEGGYFPVPELFGTYVYPTQLCQGSRFTPESGDILTDKAIELGKSI